MVLLQKSFPVQLKALEMDFLQINFLLEMDFLLVTNLLKMEFHQIFYFFLVTNLLKMDFLQINFPLDLDLDFLLVTNLLKMDFLRINFPLDLDLDLDFLLVANLLKMDFLQINFPLDLDLDFLLVANLPSTSLRTSALKHVELTLAFLIAWKDWHGEEVAETRFAITLVRKARGTYASPFPTYCPVTR